MMRGRQPCSRLLEFQPSFLLRAMGPYRLVSKGCGLQLWRSPGYLCVRACCCGGGCAWSSSSAVSFDSQRVQLPADFRKSNFSGAWRMPVVRLRGRWARQGVRFPMTVRLLPNCHRSMPGSQRSQASARRQARRTQRDLGDTSAGWVQSPARYNGLLDSATGALTGSLQLAQERGSGTSQKCRGIS